MIPAAAVVARPRGGIALASGVARPRQHERPLIGLQRQQPFKGSARIFHAVDIVDFGVSSGARTEPRLVNAMHHINRHGLRWAVEDRRLVHVIPEPRNAHRVKIPVQIAPPHPRASLGEVRKHRRPRPDAARIDRAVRILHKFVARDSRVIGRVSVAGIVGNMQIGNRNGVEVLGGEFSNHAGEIWKVRLVDGEWPIVLLIVDVEVDGIDRDMIGAQAARHLQHSRLRVIAVAGLLVAQRPQRWQRRRPGQPGIGLHDLFRRRSIEKVLVQRTVFRSI